MWMKWMKQQLISVLMLRQMFPDVQCSIETGETSTYSNADSSVAFSIDIPYFNSKTSSDLILVPLVPKREKRQELLEERKRRRAEPKLEEERKSRDAGKETEWGRAVDRTEERHIQEVAELRAQRRKCVRKEDEQEHVKKLCLSWSVCRWGNSSTLPADGMCFVTTVSQ